MVMIAQRPDPVVGRPVIDKTGLTGFYDFTLKWTPQPGSGICTVRPAAGGPPDRRQPRIPMRRTSSRRCRSSWG